MSPFTYSASAALMRNFFAPRSEQPPQPFATASPNNSVLDVDDCAEEDAHDNSQPESESAVIFTGYSSDEDSEGNDDVSDNNGGDDGGRDDDGVYIEVVDEDDSEGGDPSPGRSNPSAVDNFRLSHSQLPTPRVRSASDKSAAESTCDNLNVVTVPLLSAGSLQASACEPLRVRSTAPPLKRQRLEIPYREARKRKQEERRKELTTALDMMERLIKSKKTEFDAGANGVQARRARCIQSHLHTVLHNGRDSKEASERAAESNGLARKWGERMVRQWVREWVNKRELPNSLRGKHPKMFSLLDDPVIRAEMRSFIRSNKWCMDPAKLAEFSAEKMVPDAAKKYLHHIVDKEIPNGLKKYLELELFPHVVLL
ncbi:hypothetical protein EUX98_g8422 [Antrodiella citrinella]|uniref:Uncharacterized protein n=1 Tax=Antrodiella citrinella TaxID=2447956 RepID=A0A4S4M9E2_9APHY|nr:hypothetical protein EUX98_g8422 [Antrodiella citrinella]